MYPKGFLRDINIKTNSELSLLDLILSDRVRDILRLGGVIESYCVYMERDADALAMCVQAEEMGLDLNDDIQTARAILLSRGMGTKWTTERPTEPGDYWFAGWREKSNAVYGSKPDVYLCHVYEDKTGKVVIVGGGTVLREGDDSHGTLGVWAPAQVPELPTDILSELKSTLSK